MAALTADRKSTTQRGDKSFPDLQVVPVKASTKIYAGSLVVIDAGYAAPGRAATGLIAIGRAEKQVDNSSGSAGDLSVEVRRGVFKFGNSASTDQIAQANVGQDCFIVDDQTVALTSAGGTRSRAGKILAVDSAGVEVLVGFSSGQADSPAIQVGTLTLASGTKTQNTGVRISASSKVFVSLNTPAGGTQGVKYKVPDASLVVGEPGTGAFAVTAVDNAGATVATDTSTINYMIVG